MGRQFTIRPLLVMASVLALVAAEPARAQLTCGDGILDAGEQCDEGPANGSLVSCCNSDCTFRSAGATCRAAVDACDAQEQCSGVDGTCPVDILAPSGTTCRAAAGVCDAPESCDGVTASCPADGFQPDGTPCADQSFCNGLETCQAGVCANGQPPCLICEETSRRCLNEFCPPAPLACRTAARSALRIRNEQDDDRHDRLSWKVSRGPSTSGAELSDPRVTARYSLCIYTGTAHSLIEELSVAPRPFDWTPPASGWTSAPPDGRGFNYVDPSALHDGAYRIRLRPSDAGRTRILVRGRGVNLGDPLYSSSLALPVVTQLINHQTGVCWDATYNDPRQNTVGEFKALR